MILTDGNVTVRTLDNANIEMAALSRENNMNFFGSPTPNRKLSRQWIVNHRLDEQDAILGIFLEKTGRFIGTIGYTIRNNDGEAYAEVGRLSLFLPSVREELSASTNYEFLNDVMASAAGLLAHYLFQNYPVCALRAAVLRGNGFSESLVSRMRFKKTGHMVGDMNVYSLTRNRYNLIKEKKSLFYQHNMIEETHNAISDFIVFMQRQHVNYTFLAKRVMENQLFQKIGSPKVRLLENTPLYGSFIESFDLLHIIYDGKHSLMICAAAYIYGIPYILTFHGGSDTNEIIFRDSVRDKTVFFANQASTVTVVCKADEDTLRKLGVVTSIEITPPTITPFPIAIPKNGKDYKRIAIVSRFIHKKGIDTAIRALKYLPSEFTLDIVGDGPLRQELQQLANEELVNDRITWHGVLPIEDTMKILAGDGILWHPARRAEDGNAEGVPQILLYALYARMLVITTDSGNISSVIHDGENGVLVNPASPQQLAEVTIQALIQKEQYAKRAELSVRPYLIDNEASHWCDIYAKTRNAWKNMK